MADKTIAPEANRLYWDSESSVGEIANKLGVSRRALYDVIEPMAAGRDCSECGAELYFSNRSARASNTARCLMCGHQGAADDEVSHEDVGVVPPYTNIQPAPHNPRNRAVTLTAFAVAGVLIGALLTLLLRRKR